MALRRLAGAVGSLWCEAHSFLFPTVVFLKRTSFENLSKTSKRFLKGSKGFSKVIRDIFRIFPISDFCVLCFVFTICVYYVFTNTVRVSCYGVYRKLLHLESTDYKQIKNAQLQPRIMHVAGWLHGNKAGVQKWQIAHFWRKRQLTISFQ